MSNPTLTADGLKLSLGEQEMRYLKQFLEAGDRGGFYMAYYQMVSSDDSLLVASDVGKRQAALQTKIATFSGNVGAVAYFANRILQEARGAGTSG